MSKCPVRRPSDGAPCMLDELEPHPDGHQWPPASPLPAGVVQRAVDAYNAAMPPSVRLHSAGAQRPEMAAALLAVADDIVAARVRVEADKLRELESAAAASERAAFARLTRDPWPGYPVRVPLVGRVVEVSVESIGATTYNLCIDADHESVEVPLMLNSAAAADAALPSFVVGERDLVDAIGDVLQLGRRAAFSVDVRRAIDELRALHRELAAEWTSQAYVSVIPPEARPKLLEHVAAALLALGEVKP